MNFHATINNRDELVTTLDRQRNRYFVGYQRYLTLPLMREFLRDPDAFLVNSAGPFFKSDIGDTTTIGVVKVGDLKLVVKRYNIKGWRHFLKKCWRASNALRTWRNVQRLQQLGIDTITPVAAIEDRCCFGWLRSKAYFISEYVAGIRGCDYFGKDAQPIPEWDRVVANVCAMIRKMHNAQIEHRDFQYGNLLIVGERVLLLDLDHMKFHQGNCSCRGVNCSAISRRCYERALRKDLEHFLEFLQPNQIASQKFCEAFKEFLVA